MALRSYECLYLFEFCFKEGASELYFCIKFEVKVVKSGGANFCNELSSKFGMFAISPLIASGTLRSRVIGMPPDKFVLSRVKVAALESSSSLQGIAGVAGGGAFWVYFEPAHK